MLTLGHRLLNGTLVAALLLAAAPAFVQQASAGEGIGIVTGIQGQATVSRVALPQPAALRFKDDVFFRDQIATREHSTVRLLLGGKGSLTVREQSQVTLDEAVTPDGGRRSVIGLLAGKIGAAIAHALMRPGESVEIQTPNAVAAVRGTVLIAEYIPPQGSAAASQPILLASAAPGPVLAQAAGAGGTSNFFVLSGQVTITPQGQPPLTLGPLQAVSVTATPGGVQAGAVRNITPAEAVQAAQGLETGKPHTGEAEGSKTAQAQAEVAAAITNVILQATAGQPTSTTVTAPPTPTNTVTPVVAQSAIIGENALPAGPLLSLDNVTLGLATGTSLATFSAGAANTVTPLGIGGGGVAVLTAPLLEATGTPITHDGAIVTLDNAAAIVGASEDTTTPLVKIDGTALTNTGGAVFNLSGGSALTTSGPVLALQAGGSATLAGVMSIGGGSVVALGPADALVIPSGSSLTATAPLLNVTGESVLSTYEGGSLVAIDPSTLTLNAPILSATDSYVVLGGPVLRVVDSTVTGSSAGGLVALQNSSLYLMADSLLNSQGSTVSFAGPMVSLTPGSGEGGSTLQSIATGAPLFNLNSGSLTLTGGGALLAVDGGSVNLPGSLLAASGTTIKFNGGSAPVQLNNAGLTLSNGGSLMSLAAGATATSGGPFLDSVNSDIALDGPIFAVLGGSTITQTAGPIIRLNGGSLTADRILGVSGTGNTVDTTGTLLDLQNASVTLRILGDNPEDSGGRSRNILAHNEPLIRMADSDLTLTEPGGSLIDPGSHWLMSSDGVGLIATSTAGNTISLAGPLLNLDSVTLTATDPQIQLTNMTVSQSGSLPNSLIEVLGAPANPVTTAGPLLAATNSTLSSEASFLHVGNGVQFSSTSPTPLVQLTGSSVTTAGPFALFDGGARVTPGGSGAFLDSVNSNITINGPIFAVRGGSSVTQTGGPLVRLSGSYLYASGGFGDSDGTGNRVTVGGTLLDATDTSVYLGSGASYSNGTDVVTWAQPAGVPQVRLTNSSLTSEDNFLNFTDGTSTYSGLLLVASGSTITLLNNGTNLTNLMEVWGGDQVTTTSTAPLIQLSNSSVTAGTHLLNMEPDYSTSTLPSLTVAGPLLSDSGSTFTIAGSFLRVRDGSTLSYNSALPTPPALLQFTNSAVTMNGNLFNVGSDPGQPGSTVTLAGPLLSATNSTFDTGPNWNFFGVRDGATFTSTTTDPLLSLTGGSITADGHLLNVGLSNAWSGTGSAAVLVPTGSQAPVSMTLAGPLLEGTDTTITATYSLVNIRDNATFVSTTTLPLISLGGTTGSTLTLGGPDPDSTSPTFGQQINGRVFDVSPTLTAGFAASAELFGPVLSATNTTISTTDRILGVFSETGASATLISHTTDPLVQLTGGSVTMSGTFYPPTTSDSGTTTDTSGSFLRMSSPDPEAPATITLAGPLLYADGTTFYGQNHFLRIGSNAQVTSTTSDPLVTFTGISLTTDGNETFTPTTGEPTTSSFGDFFRLYGGGSVSLVGPLLSDSGSTFNLAGQLFQVRDASTFTGNGSLPLLQLVNSYVTAAGNLVNFSITGPTISLAGPLLSATGATLANGDPTSNAYSFIFVGDSAELKSTGSSALLSFDNTSVDTAGNILTIRRSNSVDAPTKLTLGGPLFSATNNSSFNTTTLGNPSGACCSGFFVGQGAQLTSSSSSPLISLSNSTFNAGPDSQSGGSFFGVTDTGSFSGEANTLVAPSSVNLAGPLLHATDSTITALFNLLSVSGSSLTSTSTDPLIQLSGTTGTTLTLGGTRTDPLSPGSTAFGYLLDISGSESSVTPATMSLQGPLLSSTNSSITATGSLLGIFGQTGTSTTVSSTTPDPFVQLTGGTLTLAGTYTYTSGSFLYLCCSNATLTLAGPLLSATDSALTIAGSLVSISGGGQLTSTTTDPLITVTGGTHEIGSGTYSGSGSLLDLWGVNTDPTTGLGIDQVLQTGGTIFQASDATINLGGSGNAIVVDTAMLTASAPIVNLINSTLNTSPTGDSNGAMWVNQSYGVTSVGPVFQLNNSILKVWNGPLLSVTGGSQMTVNGDFASLINGSTINVVNGPLISVSGTSPTNSSIASNLNITGALVNFGGTGGNQVIINNGITPNGFPGGIPVSQQCDGGCSISIPGPNPIKNPSLGTVTVNGVPVTSTGTSYTGSLIRATNGGTVTVHAP